MTNVHLRLWARGTRRLLSILSASPEADAVLKQVTLEREVWGDFKFCPLEIDKPRVSQKVRVASASNLHWVVRSRE